MLKPLLSMLVIALGSSLLWAAPSEPTAAQIQEQLQQAQKKLQQQQQQKQQLDGNIAQTQTSLQQATTQLQQLTTKQQRSQADLMQLQQKLETLTVQSQQSKTQVQRLLNSQYKNKQPDALVLMLKNSNPNDKGRQMAYMRYLNQANDQVLAGLKQQLLTIDAQQQKINSQNKALQKLQQQTAQVTKQLSLQQSAQLKQNRELMQDIAKQQTHIQQLKRDEARLNQLMAQLSRKPVSKRDNQSQPPVIPNKPTKPTQIVHSKPETKPQSKVASSNSHLTQEDLTLNAPGKPALTASDNNRFAQMQGRMSLPSSGNIIGRYGQTRSSGGTWKGLFISNQGAAVHSVATGEVAYAAPLAGYGNTVIVDHSAGYMTVYAGMSRLSVTAGQRVNTRTFLGNSGQMPTGEQGLYFEVRYQNRSMNPLSWVG